MSRSSLKFLAVVLSVLILVVVLAGFDNLPRDLRKQVDAERSQLASAQTGIRSAQDVKRLAQCGARAVLVGEGLVTAKDVGAKVRELAGVGPG